MADDDDVDVPGPPDERPVSSATSDAAKQALARARAASRTAPSAAPRPGSRGDGRRQRSGGGEQMSGPGPDARDPQRLGSSVDRLMRERGWEQPTAVGGLTGRWAEIVGADVAAHVVPESFDAAPDGPGLVLVLRADSSSWAYTMRTLLPDLRRRIDVELGAGTVRDISVLGPASPSWKHGKLHVKGRGPRDTYG